jgi:hypothetical protein
MVGFAEVSDCSFVYAANIVNNIKIVVKLGEKYPH